MFATELLTFALSPILHVFRLRYLRSLRSLSSLRALSVSRPDIRYSRPSMYPLKTLGLAARLNKFASVNPISLDLLP
jgi:hypothetical protein